jgi:hypothetical protein
VLDDGKIQKEKRKREIAGKLGKEMIDRREEWVLPCPFLLLADGLSPFPTLQWPILPRKRVPAA